MKNFILFIGLIAIGMISCKVKNEKERTTPITTKTNTDKPPTVLPTKAPIINIIDTVELKRLVLCIKDSAATNEILNDKLAAIFTKKLPDAILLGKLKIMGEPIVWYKLKKAPYFFQAGIPVDKAPVKMGKGMFITKTGGDSAFVAHFFGPNELMGVGYDALNEMMKEKNKKRTAASYEVYTDNKFLELNKKKDPYKLQTDIVMPYKRK